ADHLRLLRNHGMRRRYHHETLGYNFRMTDLQAALGLAQLPHLERWTEGRRANAAFYDAGLRGVTTPAVRPEARHVYHQYTLRVGVVGGGSMGYNHARVLAEMDGVELVGVADPDAGARHRIARRFKVPTFDDHHELLERGEPQAVTVVVPTRLHHEVAITAIKA